MPYPAQINHDLIVERASEMIESDGLDHLTLQNLAKSLGVQAPSLYRHVKNKPELLRAVNEMTNRRLVAALTDAVAINDDPAVRVIRLARAYRAFAQANPATYGLAYTNTLPELEPDPAVLEMLALPLQGVMAELVGAAQSLTALRGLWALAHGFAMLELCGQFRRGGDLDEVFDQTVEAYLRGWT
jgi:AcrR family transcriptional regulator